MSHAPRLDDADDTRHGDAAYADMACIVLENLLRCHFTYGLQHARVHQVDDLIAPNEVHARDDDEPYQHGATANDEGVFQTDDVTQTEHGSACVHLEHQFGFVGQGSAPTHHAGGEGL